MSGQAWYEDDSKLSNIQSSQNSAKHENEKDRLLREQIWKDVQRTYPGLHYFTEETYTSLERMLYIYAKLNPNINYCQGMNEIIAPLSFVCKVKTSLKQESLCFFIFCKVMNNLQGMYVTQTKNTTNFSSTITEKINAFKWLLYKHDYQLFKHLTVDLNIETWFYLFRWLTTLLSREFSLPDILRLWDTLFSNFISISKNYDFLLYICCSMIILQKEVLLSSDFTQTMEILQNYPFVDIKTVLNFSIMIYKKDLEDNITLDLLKHKTFQAKDTNINIPTVLEEMNKISTTVSNNLTEVKNWFADLQKTYNSKPN